MIESRGVALSMSTNSLILKSGRSGAFSCTKSAFDNASLKSEVRFGGRVPRRGTGQ